MTPDAAAKLETVHPGQDDVEDDEIGYLVRQKRKRRRCVVSGCNAVTGKFEVSANDGAQIAIVIDDEDRVASSGRRRCAQSVSKPSKLDTQIAAHGEPACDETNGGTNAQALGGEQRFINMKRHERQRRGKFWNEFEPRDK